MGIGEKYFPSLFEAVRVDLERLGVLVDGPQGVIWDAGRYGDFERVGNLDLRSGDTRKVGQDIFVNLTNLHKRAVAIHRRRRVEESRLFLGQRRCGRHRGVGADGLRPYPEIT